MVVVKSKKLLRGGWPAHLKNLKKKSLKQEKEKKKKINKFQEMNNNEIIKKYKIKVYNKEKILIFESFFYDPLFKLIKNKIINIAKEKEIKYVAREEWEDGWEYYDVKTKKKNYR